MCRTWNFSKVWSRPWFFKTLIFRNQGADWMADYIELEIQIFVLFVGSPPLQASSRFALDLWLLHHWWTKGFANCDQTNFCQVAAMCIILQRCVRGAKSASARLESIEITRHLLLILGNQLLGKRWCDEYAILLLTLAQGGIIIIIISFFEIRNRTKLCWKLL